MRTYNERLPMIDEAIEKLDSEWVKVHSECNNLIVSTEENTYHGAGVYQGYSYPCDVLDVWEFVCTRQEFEQRVEELRSKKTLEKDKSYTLDELSEIEGAFDEGKTYLCVETNSIIVYTKGWSYKTNGRGIIDNHDKGDGVSSCNSGALSKFKLVESRSSFWYKKGELPTVGSKCRVRIDDKMQEVEVLAYHGSGVYLRAWVYGMNRGYRTVMPRSLRPLRTERYELIDKYADKIMRDGNCNGDEMFTVEEAVALMYDNDWRPTED